VVLAAAGLGIAAQPPATIFAIAKNAFTGLAVLFPTTIAALYFADRVHPLSCILSILVGELLLVGFLLEWIPPQWTFGFLEVVPILVGATVALLGSNALLRSRK